ncbi:MAG: hypothetical protein IPJ71_00315 [Bdellovibrionales bacterium]|nr:hypothetical protein [Bdellovibrionales bacterium]
MQLLLGRLSKVVAQIHTSENLQIAQTQTSDESGPILTVNQRNVIRFFAYKTLRNALDKNDNVAAQAALEALKNPERFTLVPVSESPTPFRNSDGYSMSSAEVMATFEAIRLALEKVEKTVSLAVLEEAREVNSDANILADLRSEIQRLTSDGNTEGAASFSPLILDRKPEPPMSEGDLAHPSPNPSLDTIVEPRIEKGVLARSLYALGAKIVEYRKNQQRKLQEWLEKRQETKQQARQNRIQARQASNTGDFKSKDYSRGLPELHGPPTAKDTALYIARIIAIPYALSTPCVGVCLALGRFYQTATLVDSVMGTIMLGGVMGGLVQLVTMPITCGACSRALVTYKKGQEALRNGESFYWW